MSEIEPNDGTTVQIADTHDTSHVCVWAFSVHGARALNSEFKFNLRFSISHSDFSIAWWKNVVRHFNSTIVVYGSHFVATILSAFSNWPLENCHPTDFNQLKSMIK